MGKPAGCIHKCIPFLIHSSEVKAGTNRNLGSHVDLAPTILHLLGIAEPPESWLGASLLAPGRRKVLFRDGISVHKDSEGGLARKNDKTDRKFIEYSDAMFNRARD